MMRFAGESAEIQSAVTITIDGKECQAYEGDTVAVALYTNGLTAWRRSRAGEMRGVLCGMGTCFDCLVSIDGAAGMRACQVRVREGMRVETSLAGRGAT